MIGICSYCVLDRPVFERCQTLLHPELTPWWSFPLADGAHHKKPHSPTHPSAEQETNHNLNQWWPSSLMHICGTRGRWVKLTHCGLVMPHSNTDLAMADSGNGLLPDDIKWLVVWWHQATTWTNGDLYQQFHKKCKQSLSLTCVYFLNYHISKEPKSYSLLPMEPMMQQ